MILPERGCLLGSGHLMAGDQARGTPVSCTVTAESDHHGLTFTGSVEPEGGDPVQLVVNFHPDDVGQYHITGSWPGLALEGRAKLATAPAMALIYTEDGKLCASFTVFDVPGGLALRGIVHNAGTVVTCEIAFSGEPPAVAGDNVISLRGRRSR